MVSKRIETLPHIWIQQVDHNINIHYVNIINMNIQHNNKGIAWKKKNNIINCWTKLMNVMDHINECYIIVTTKRYRPDTDSKRQQTRASNIIIWNITCKTLPKCKTIVERSHYLVLSNLLANLLQVTFSEDQPNISLVQINKLKSHKSSKPKFNQNINLTKPRIHTSKNSLVQ